MKTAFSRPVLRGGVLVLAAASLTALAPIQQAEARGRDNAGAAIAAGVAGLAIGAIIGSASANSPRYYAAPPATTYYPPTPTYTTYSAPVYAAPTYAAPTYAPPVYSAPTYVVQQPQPIYVQPQPVYVQPVPVYSAPSPSINIGFGYSAGPRYHSRSRGWGGRDDWRGDRWDRRDRWR